jgi:hypothetical protein
MADQDDARRIALALPETSESDDHFGFYVRGKQFAWAWNERVDPKKPRVPRADVLVVRVPDREDKAALLASDAGIFFIEPHYANSSAVLVRLPRVALDQLAELITDAWRTQAPPALAEAWARG